MLSGAEVDLVHDPNAAKLASVPGAIKTGAEVVIKAGREGVRPIRTKAKAKMQTKGRPGRGVMRIRPVDEAVMANG